MNKTGIYFGGALVVMLFVGTGLTFSDTFSAGQTYEKHTECIDATCTVVEGPGDNYCLPEGSTCGSVEQVCVDTDVLGEGRERLFARGGINSGAGTVDHCEGDKLIEHYCGEDGEEIVEYVCHSGCLEGGCLVSSSDTCTDNDSGTHEYGCATKGNVTICDFCSVGSTFTSVFEARCLGPQHLRYIETTCGPEGCYNGACGGGNGTHAVCIDNYCAQINGPGEDECETAFDCATETHAICFDDACVLVIGPGENECEKDFDCIT